MIKKWQRYLLLIPFLLLIAFAVWYLRPVPKAPNEEKILKRDEQDRLIVVASSFPVYDFARIVGGDQASVSLILPPGVESHAYRPDSAATAKINSATIFFYTSDLLEPWVKENVFSPYTMTAAANGLADESNDPHVWLDFTLARIMVENISQAYQTVDPEHAELYQARAASYQAQLDELDQDFSKGLANCQWREIISGGHHAFAYLAKRYHLNYESVQGVTPDDSVDLERVMTLSAKLKESKQPYVYFEELIMPYLAELIHQGSGARLMSLNAAHNVGRFDTSLGLDFLSLMHSNLDSLRLGLNCQ